MLLATWDTDRIKHYVFGTSRLREIRGASAILDELNDTEIRREVSAIVGESRIIYTGGGTALALVDNQAQVDELTQKIERRYSEETHTAEITSAFIEVAKEDLETRFGEMVRLLNHKLRAVKDGKASTRNCISSPVLKVCESCGQYPASTFDKSSKDFVCCSCEAKRKRGRAIRDGLHGYRSRLGDFLQTQKAKERWPGAGVENAPEDFNDIGAVSRPPGYIGFIYCDGNRMGDVMGHLGTREAFRTFSSELRNTMVEVVSDSLIESFGEMRPLPDKADKRVLPFEIIFIGGDDLMLVAAADKAVEIACTLCSRFEEHGARIFERAGISPPQRLSMSAGVVLAHASLPIYHLQTVADDLLKSAKRRSLDLLRNRDEERSCIDFHVVTASASESPALMRKTEWVRQSEGLSLTERPYTPNELLVLLDRIRALRRSGFPNSKLQLLYEAIVDRSKENAMFTWAFVAGRARRSNDEDKNQFKKLIDFFAEPDAIRAEEDGNLLPDSGGLSQWPWRKRDGDRLSTPMLDVAELYDFIR